MHKLVVKGSWEEYFYLFGSIKYAIFTGAFCGGSRQADEVIWSSKRYGLIHDGLICLPVCLFVLFEH